MAKKASKDFFKEWIKFWHERWSVFKYKHYNDINNPEDVEIIPISAEKLLRKETFTKKDKLNLFFSINGYKNDANNCKTKNITKWNTFFFDIDLWIDKKNNIPKRKARTFIKPFAEEFDFIIETPSWWHLYILLDESKYSIENKDEYLADWEKRGKTLQTAIWLEFDPACFLPTQIARVVSSLHQKIGKEPQEILLLKGEDILFPNKERESIINSIPIRDVLDELGIEYRGKNIIEDWRVTNGWKIKWNYVNDISKKWRPSWPPFAFVKNRYIRNGKSGEFLISDVFDFFEEHFGIEKIIYKFRKIPIPQEIERILATSNNLTGKDFQTLLILISYSKIYFQKQLPYGTTIPAHISDILKTAGVSENTSNFIANLNQLKEKLNTFTFSTKNITLPLLSFTIEKVKNDRMIKYLILPLWYHSKSFRRPFRKKHYINTNALNIATKWKQLWFYLHLCCELLSVKRLISYEMSKKELCSIFWDKKVSRIKEKLVDIISITEDFSFTTTWKFIQFQKV